MWNGSKCHEGGRFGKQFLVRERVDRLYSFSKENIMQLAKEMKKASAPLTHVRDAVLDAIHEQITKT